MKLIFLVLLGLVLAVIDSALLTDLKFNLKHLVSAALRLRSNENSEDDHENTGTRRFEDYDSFKQNKKVEEWGKKYNFNIEVEPKQGFEDRDNRNERKANNKPIFLTQYRKGDVVDQMIPQIQLPKKSASKLSKNYFHMDSILNSLRRYPSVINKADVSQPKYRVQPKRIDYRRAENNKNNKDHHSSTSSSSRELPNFKDEFRQEWLKKKFEAMNKTRIRGDKVNMLAARPWGVPCGDANQHDMPWGTCMLAVECEPELRVFRGDLFCGRTQYICCALQLTTYDTYQGFDVSLDDKGLSTDSNERELDKGKSSKELKRKKKKKEQEKRRRTRNQRKKKIKRHIKRIVKEIRRILDKQYRNGTKQRKKRTNQLKKFITDLKKQYKKDRQLVKDIHTNDMIQIDTGLLVKLKQMQVINKNFAANATFREAVLKGTMTKEVARMLLHAYPELDEFLEARRAGPMPARRSGGGVAGHAGVGEAPSDDNVFEYDVEYGYLYY